MTIKRPHRTIDDSPISLGLISRFLNITGTTVDSGTVTYTDVHLPGLLWELSDIGRSDGDVLATGETLLHILHAQDQDSSIIDVDDQMMPIHPGDSIYIGGSPAVLVSAGILMLLIQFDRRGNPGVSRPHHGTESFDGLNRRTVYDTGQHFTFERWKLTTPQTIETQPGCALAMVGLFGNISCIEGNTIEALHAGESFVAAQGRVRLIPDGLAYIALIAIKVS